MMVIDGVEMVDVQEAARLVRRTPETVRRWVWTGKLSSVKQGNKLLVPRAEVRVEESPAGERADLASWAQRLGCLPAGKPGATASDLVFEDRAERAGR